MKQSAGIENAKMMVVQDIYGDGADTVVPRKSGSMAYTMMRIDPFLLELGDLLSDTAISPPSDADTDLRDAVNDVLRTRPGQWECFGSPRDASSCLNPKRPVWDPCGGGSGSGKTVEGKVFAMRRMASANGGGDPHIKVISHFDVPLRREFVTEYCAFVQYEV